MQPKRPNAICRIPMQSFPAPNPKTLRSASGGAFFIKQGEIFFIGNAHCGGTEYEKNSRNADNEPRGIKARGVHKLADKAGCRLRKKHRMQWILSSSSFPNALRECAASHRLHADGVEYFTDGENSH